MMNIGQNHSLLLAFAVSQGELGIFIDRDQRSIFLGFEFRKSVFFWVAK